ncbi:NnrS protein [compost metagenome]
MALGAPWQWHVRAASAHGLLFILGAIPLLIAGFMSTADPKWLRRNPVDARELRLPVGLFMIGWAVAVIDRLLTLHCTHSWGKL